MPFCRDREEEKIGWVIIVFYIYIYIFLTLNSPQGDIFFLIKRFGFHAFARSLSVKPFEE